MNKYKPCLLIRQLLLASTLSAGFGTLWFLFVLIVCTLVLEVWAGPEANWPPREELVVKTDGTLLVKSTPRGNPLNVSYRDLSGRAAPTPSAAELIEGTYLMGGSLTQGFSPMGLDSQTRLKVFADRQQPGVLWYFLHNGAIDGAGYFVGFDRPNNARVGFIGESGFRADRPPPGEQFPVEELFDGARQVLESRADRHQPGKRDRSRPERLAESPELGACPIRQSPATGRPEHPQRPHGISVHGANRVVWVLQAKKLRR